GGDRLADAGLELMLHNRELSVGGGPRELLSKIPLRHRLERQLEKRLFGGEKIDGALLCDNGEINLRLASLLHFFDVPVVYFIPPKVWVWRASRIEAIEQHVDLVLSILPFEEPIYRSWEIPFQYVGNPLVDEVDTKLSEEEAKLRLSISPERRVLAVFVGSRHSEVRHHARVFGQAVRKFLESLPAGERKPVVLLPAAQAIEPEALRASFAEALDGLDVDLKVVKGMSHECLRAARAAVVKSGTSTLEAALLGTPMVLAYASSRSTAWIYRNVVRYRGFVGLVNLFLADKAERAMGFEEALPAPVVAELILERCTPELISSELTRVWRDGAERDGMLAQLARTRKLLAPSGPGDPSPLKRAAGAAWELFSKPPAVADV
ncbi:MAG: hypothetical protein HY075_13025, partial [Deltaproteobacteria bacterium]|nr:hypothetical protein [Deltaproteobacteria bacterium]